MLVIYKKIYGLFGDMVYMLLEVVYLYILKHATFGLPVGVDGENLRNLI